jgi:hypothetical protein
MKKQLITGMVILLAALNGNAQAPRATGWVEADDEYKSVNMIEKPLGFGANLPEKYSLEQYVPSIGDQGDLGTCVGWATTYYAATIAYNVLATKNGLPTTKEWHYDPIYTFENIKNKQDNGCQFGSSSVNALIFMAANGAKRMQIDPSNCGKTVSWYNETKSLLDITDAYFVFSPGDTRNEKIEAVCQVISDNKPVVIGMDCPLSFFQIGSDGVFKPGANEASLADAGHAMCLVGYDDKKLGGAFKVVNSWGGNWGDKGYCWIKYDDFIKYVPRVYFFDYELKNIASDACAYGDCNGDYGIQKIKGKKGTYGTFEGFFSGGKMTKGIYYNNSKLGGKGGVGFMKKTVKKAGSGAELIYEGGDYKNPVGFILR